MEEKPRAIQFEALESECAENPMRFSHQWQGKTFIVTGIVDSFAEEQYFMMSGAAKVIRGNLMVLRDKRQSLFCKTRMVFRFSPDASDFFDVSKGDEVDIKGPLLAVDATSSEPKLIFANCSVEKRRKRE